MDTPTTTTTEAPPTTTTQEVVAPENLPDLLKKRGWDPCKPFGGLVNPPKP